MNKVTASYAKQSFGDVPARAVTAPVAIEQHGKVVAALVPPDWLARASAQDQRLLARQAQQAVEQARLMAHQRLGIELLVCPVAQRRRLLKTAREEVRRWEAQRLCSQDYIARWDEWLALPVARLVDRMCSDAGG